MAAPVLKTPIPTQAVNELAAFGPLNLRDYIQVPQGSEAVRFAAVISEDDSLPKGLICTPDGIITGIPAKGTQGNYEIIIRANNNDGSLKTSLMLTIKPVMSADANYFDQLKAQVWEAVDKKMPIPDFNELHHLPVTTQDVLYLLERFGMIKIWDAYNLSPPGAPEKIELEGVSKHYQVYDRGSCLVAAPKELFSQERNLEDGLQTARAMAREVYRREWAVELVGFIKYTRAAWIELQHLSDTYGKSLEIINFDPSNQDVNLYATQAIQREINRKEP